MTDTKNNVLLRPIEAAEWFRRRLRLPRAPHSSNLGRWRQGQGTNGVKLRATVLGGRNFYAEADLEAFVVALNNAGEVRS